MNLDLAIRNKQMNNLYNIFYTILEFLAFINELVINRYMALIK